MSSTTDRLSVPTVRSLQWTAAHPASLTSMLVPSHLRQGLSREFPPSFPTNSRHALLLTFRVYTSHSYFMLTTRHLQGNTNIWRGHTMVNKRTLSTHVLRPLAPRSQDDRTLPNPVACRMLTVGNSLTANRTTWRHCSLGPRSVPRSRESLFRHDLQCSQQTHVDGAVFNDGVSC